MLLLDPTPRLRDRIIGLLCGATALSVQQISKILKSQQCSYSKQAIYKELLLLEEHGLVVRAKSKFRISLTWIYEFLTQADYLAEACEKGSFAGDLLPPSGKHYSWQFTDIKRTDRLWVHLVVSALQNLSSPKVYQYLPHPWHGLLHDSLDQQYANAIRASKAVSYIVVGGDTYLDRLFVKNMAEGRFICSNAPGPFEREAASYLTIIGEYLITTSYPGSFVRAVNQYFSRIRSKRDIKSQEVMELFQKPGKVVTKIERNQKKSERTRRKFEEYFG